MVPHKHHREEIQDKVELVFEKFVEQI
jgi:hypothetical protein